MKSPEILRVSLLYNPNNFVPSFNFFNAEKKIYHEDLPSPDSSVNPDDNVIGMSPNLAEHLEDGHYKIITDDKMGMLNENDTWEFFVKDGKLHGIYIHTIRWKVTKHIFIDNVCINSEVSY